MFQKWFSKPHIDVLADLVSEVYALLAVARSDQQVVITINDPQKEENMIIRLNGRLWKNVDNPMSELREFHHILAINVRNNRIITCSLEG
jgi:hypothetical protein